MPLGSIACIRSYTRLFDDSRDNLALSDFYKHALSLKFNIYICLPHSLCMSEVLAWEVVLRIVLL